LPVSPPGRLVQVGSQTQISGAVLPFDRDTSEELLKLLRKIAKRAEKEKQEVRRALRMRGRREDSAPVLLQNLQPALDIGGMCNLLWS